MSGQADKTRIRQQDATTEGSSAALARQKHPARSVNDLYNVSIAPNGACRLHFLSWSTYDSGQPLRIDSGLILTRSTLTTLAEALPKALDQAEQALVKSTEAHAETPDGN